MANVANADGLEALAERVSRLEAELDASKPAKRCMTVRQVCEAFSISRSTWDRWLADRSNGLRALVDTWTKGEARLRVPVREFEEWLTTNRWPRARLASKLQ